MAFLALTCEFDASVATGRNWTRMIRRSSGNIPAMNWSIWDVLRKIGTTKLSKTPNMAPGVDHR